jgi:hypothetical protein
MTTRLAGGPAAITLAVGILVGAAGTIVIRDAADPRTDPVAAMADQVGGMQSMMGMMGGSMMGGSMMGGPGTNGQGMGPGAMPGPAGSAGPQVGPGPLHDLHHPAVSPVPTR